MAQQSPDSAKFRDTTIVILDVGEKADSRLFRVHKHLICQASLVFKASFTGGLIENSKQMMLLPHESKDVVERFVQWLYTKDFEVSDNTNAEGAPLCYQQLAELHVFADRYEISDLKNLVIDKFFKLGNNCESLPPPPSVVTYVYAHSTKHSSFRRLVTGLFCCYMTARNYHLPSIRDLLERNLEFTADLVIAMIERMKGITTLEPFLSGTPNEYYEDIKESHGDLDKSGHGDVGTEESVSE